MKELPLGKYVAYTLVGLTAANLIIDVVKPNYLPSDTLNNSLIVYGVSGTTSSVITTTSASPGIMVAWPQVGQISANEHVNKFGTAYYQFPSDKAKLL